MALNLDSQREFDEIEAIAKEITDAVEKIRAKIKPITDDLDGHTTPKMIARLGQAQTIENNLEVIDGLVEVSMERLEAALDPEHPLNQPVEE